LTVHASPQPRESSHPQIQAVADRLVWRAADAVHVATTFVQRSLAELRGMPPELARRIPYGVAEQGGKPVEAAELRTRLTSGNEVLVGMISASGEAEKGHAVLADALARSGPGIRAVVVGSHPGERFVEQLGALGLRERVELPGRVGTAEFGAYLEAIDVLVVPSTAYESLPLVVLEAMAAGKPVFASRLSGIPEAVVDHETGRLFTPGSANELASLLREAAHAPESLKRMGRAGRERWRQTFSLPAMTGAMLTLYEELMRGAGGGDQAEPAVTVPPQ
jgi:glycogen(starch) synthase